MLMREVTENVSELRVPRTGSPEEKEAPKNADGFLKGLLAFLRL